MTERAHIPGVSVVGTLRDIPPWEAVLIVSMRFWMDSPEGRADVCSGFDRCFGTAAGLKELRRFETLLHGICTHARRPLTRHGPACSCIGSDEAVLCALVREASRGDLAEAAMIASLMVPACHAEPIALIAAQVGIAMRRLAQDDPAPPATRPWNGDRTLH